MGDVYTNKNLAIVICTHRDERSRRLLLCSVVWNRKVCLRTWEGIKEPFHRSLDISGREFLSQKQITMQNVHQKAMPPRTLSLPLSLCTLIGIFTNIVGPLLTGLLIWEVNREWFSYLILLWIALLISILAVGDLEGAISRQQKWATTHLQKIVESFRIHWFSEII